MSTFVYARDKGMAVHLVWGARFYQMKKNGLSENKLSLKDCLCEDSYTDEHFKIYSSTSIRH